MNMVDGTIVSCTPFPSPHPTIKLFTITYISDGLCVKGLLAEPQCEEKYDGFLYLRGGIKNVGKVRPGRIIQFASQGFIVFAPFYRGNQGGEGREDFVGADRQDAIAAYKVLEHHKKVRDIHVFGFSRGGIMALWTAIQCPSVASLVTWGGVSDITLTYEERIDLRRMMKRVIGGPPSKYPERYQERTPNQRVNEIQCPVLIIHGVLDQNVSVKQAYRLEEILLKHNKVVESWYFPHFTHFFPPEINRETVKKLTNWMKQHNK
ncbi:MULTISPECIES: alpha/beta hydrolase family protein [Bacillus]|uniref:alpha/beta hydrolase family protein n=1 Tax=Bacillus TaxID=1386 RepID=UPI0002F29624|nr:MULTISPECIES: prolyl oligopeptidase family serine peptidase [Bacillus]